MSKRKNNKAKKPASKRRVKSARTPATISIFGNIEKGGALIYGFSIGSALVMGALVGLALIGETPVVKQVEEDVAALQYSSAAPPQPRLKPVPHIKSIDRPIVEIDISETPATLINDDGPLMVIVIDDMGMNSKTTDKFARIGVPMTFAFLPYADHLELQTRSIARHGHELMVHMPMEPETWDQNPGPNALLRDLEPDELRQRLNWGLNQFEGFSGINNHMGSLFTQSPAHMELVMNSLIDSGLYFLDSRTSPHSVGYEMALKMGVPTMTRDVFLDNDRNVPDIHAQLDKALAMAHKKGWSISIGHPYPQTLKALQSWLPKAKREGVRFVHMSNLMFDSPYGAQKMASAKTAPATSLSLPAELGND